MRFLDEPYILHEQRYEGGTTVLAVLRCNQPRTIEHTWICRSTSTWRMARLYGTPCAWSTKGWPQVISKALVFYGWQFVEPWKWKHDDLGEIHVQDVDNRAELNRVQHLLRQSFRRYHFSAFMRSNRREARFCNQQGGVSYTERQCAQARRMASSRPRFHVLSGATVSSAALSQMKREAMPRCPFCHTDTAPTLIHVAWHCDGLFALRNERQVPYPPSAIQQGLGWPSGNSYDDKVLDWLVYVRQRFLLDRYRWLLLMRLKDA